MLRSAEGTIRVRAQSPAQFPGSKGAGETPPPDPPCGDSGDFPQLQPSSETLLGKNASHPRPRHGGGLGQRLSDARNGENAEGH